MRYVTVEYFWLWTGHAQAVVRNPSGVEVGVKIAPTMEAVRDWVAAEYGELVREAVAS